MCTLWETVQEGKVQKGVVSSTKQTSKDNPKLAMQAHFSTVPGSVFSTKNSTKPSTISSQVLRSRRAI
jgi:hypothetical protein